VLYERSMSLNPPPDCGDPACSGHTRRAGKVRAYRIEDVPPGHWPLNRRNNLSAPLEEWELRRMERDLGFGKTVSEWIPLPKGGRKRKVLRVD